MDEENGMQDVEIQELVTHQKRGLPENDKIVYPFLFALVTSITILITCKEDSSYIAAILIVGFLAVFFYLVSLWGESKKLKKKSFLMAVGCAEAFIITLLSYFVFKK